MIVIVIFIVVIAVMVLPWVAVAVLLLIGVVFPEVRRKGIRQLRQPFALRSGKFMSEYRLNKRRHALEDEVIARYGPLRQQPHPTTDVDRHE